MANIKTYEISFAYLSEYSSPISVYSGSLLQPISISVGYWFATGSGTVTLLASFDNVVYNTIYSTQAINNSIIYLSIPNSVGTFIKIQRSLTELELSGINVNNATVSSSIDSNIVTFSSPQNIQINDEIYAVDRITPSNIDVLFLLGVSQQSIVQSITCQFVYQPFVRKVALPLKIIRKTPPAKGMFTCTFIEPSIVSLDIDY
jgi:hypothetical protein